MPCSSPDCPSALAGPALAETIGGEQLASTAPHGQPAARRAAAARRLGRLVDPRRRDHRRGARAEGLARPARSGQHPEDAHRAGRHAEHDARAGVRRDAEGRQHLWRAGRACEVGRTYTLDELWYAVFLPSANDAAIAVAAGERRRQEDRPPDERHRRLPAGGRHRTPATPTASTPPARRPAPTTWRSSPAPACSARTSRRTPARSGPTSPNVKGKGSHPIYTTNRLLMHGYQGMTGVKTGFTTRPAAPTSGPQARNGTNLIVSLMGIHESSESAASKLLDWGFANHDQVTPIGTLVESGRTRRRRPRSGSGDRHRATAGSGRRTDVTSTQAASPAPRPVARTPAIGLPWVAALVIAMVAGASRRGRRDPASLRQSGRTARGQWPPPVRRARRGTRGAGPPVPSRCSYRPIERDLHRRGEVGQLGRAPDRADPRPRLVGDRHVRVVRESALDRHVARADAALELLEGRRAPSSTITNTTDDSGRKVPDPRRVSRKVRCVGSDVVEVAQDRGHGIDVDVDRARAP